MEILKQSQRLFAKILVISVSSFLFSLSESFASDKIMLPAMPSRPDSTLLGVDTNRNGVRDDVEIMIYNDITKDPETFKAYVSYAKAQSLFIQGYPDEMTLIPANKKLNDAFDCLTFFDRDQKRRSSNKSKIIDLIFNTPMRNAVDKWVEKKALEYDMSYGLRRNLKKEDVCDFLK